MVFSKKGEIITFKAGEALSRAVQGIGNPSQFVRRAILAVRERVCRFCLDPGTLGLEQGVPWARFSADYYVAQCEDCHAMRIVCMARRASRTTELHA